MVWPGTVVLVVTVVLVDGIVCGPTLGRQTNLNTSLSVPFVVFAFESSCAVPLTSSPFLSGPPTGTAKFTGAVHSDALTGRPSAATAASKPLVSIFDLPIFPLKVTLEICATLHFGRAGSATLRHTTGVKRHEPLRAPSASQTSPSAQVEPLSAPPAGNPTPFVISST